MPRFHIEKPYVDNSEVKDLVGKIKSETAEFNIKTKAKSGFLSLFPIFTWIGRYNVSWLIGDVIAGITVGFLVLPQALAQAKIATLPSEYGLYTAFVGLFVYAFFATSKDVTIGPTAVLSLLTSQILISANKDASGNDIYPAATFALTLSFFTGVYELIIGFLRLGVVVDFIPGTVINGFTTGAAVTIIIQQLPSLLGIKGIDTNNQPSYLIVRDIFTKLYTVRYDAAIGLTAAFLLVFLRTLKEQFGKKNRYLFWIGLSRNGIVLVLYLVVSIIVAKTSAVDKTGTPILNYTIVGSIPAGLKTPATPLLTSGIISRAATSALSTTLVGIVEHIGIVRSFGRKFGYTRNINPSQEIIALGLTNFVGSFLSSYPATGSFSRSAVKAASGVRTPAAGFLVAAIVVVALYTLTGVFYYIPSSMLAAVIIGAMADLISPYTIWIEIWNTGLADFLVLLTAFFVTLFVGVEYGIYSSVAVAAAIILIRIARPGLKVLGRAVGGSEYVPVDDDEIITNRDSLVIRFQESITYPNAQLISNNVLKVITERTKFNGTKRKAGDRLWFDNTEEVAAANEAGNKNIERLAVLNALVFDFSAVNSFDYAGYNILLELRNEASKFAGHPIFLYFVAVKPHIKRIIINALKVPYPEEVLPLIQRDLPASKLYQTLEHSQLFFSTVDDAVAFAETTRPASFVDTDEEAALVDTKEDIPAETA